MTDHPTATPRPHPEILIVTDGACFGNPGPGGWAHLIFFPNGAVRKGTGSDPATTNNRMELMAIVAALEGLGVERKPIRILTDSQWLASCASGKWKRKANLDLWQRFDRAAAGKRLHWEWQPRNTTDHMVEVDRLAKEAARRVA